MATFVYETPDKGNTIFKRIAGDYSNRIIIASKDSESWDPIFLQIKDSLHVDMPLRLENWLKNSYHPPRKIK